MNARLRSVDTDAERPLVVTIVGTDVHPFDRLVGWLDEWAQTRPDVDVFQQIGTSTPPRRGTWERVLPLPDLSARIACAAAVVTHGGPATIADVRTCGRLPLVVPRDPAKGEHVDGHQQRYAEHIEATGKGRVITDRVELSAWLDAAISDPALLRCPIDERPLDEAIQRFTDLMDELALTRAKSRKGR